MRRFCLIHLKNSSTSQRRLTCRGRWRFQNPLEGRPPFGDGVCAGVVSNDERDRARAAWSNLRGARDIAGPSCGPLKRPRGPLPCGRHAAWGCGSSHNRASSCATMHGATPVLLVRRVRRWPTSTILHDRDFTAPVPTRNRADGLDRFLCRGQANAK
jgi:hypothetical protein